VPLEPPPPSPVISDGVVLGVGVVVGGIAVVAGVVVVGLNDVNVGVD
jgi:hypothetical protein